jgi:hypothetical protein
MVRPALRQQPFPDGSIKEHVPIKAMAPVVKGVMRFVTFQLSKIRGTVCSAFYFCTRLS